MSNDPTATPTPAQSATPRTDSQIAANEFYTSNGQHCLTINFAILAHTLERELAAKDAELTAAKNDAHNYKEGFHVHSIRADEAEKQLAASKAECERLKAQRDGLHELHNKNAKYHAELLDTSIQLRADNAKLRGLLREGMILMPVIDDAGDVCQMSLQWVNDCRAALAQGGGHE